MASGRSWEQREAGDRLEVLEVERHEWNAGGDAASGNPSFAATGLPTASRSATSLPQTLGTVAS
jgi:hypothetical protein